MMQRRRKLLRQISAQSRLQFCALQLWAGLDTGLTRGVNLALISDLSTSIFALQQLQLSSGAVEFVSKGN